MKTRKWKVRFMRKGWEPPHPFGKTTEIVEAANRKEAIEMCRSQISTWHKTKPTASPVKEDEQ